MRLQLQKGAVNASSGDVYYQSMLHGLRRVSREEGVYWLWRPGVEPTWLRAFSSTGLRIGLYNSVKNSIQATVSPGHDDRDTIPLSVKILAGGTTGAIGSAISNPIDVVRTRLQAEMAPLDSSGRYAAGLRMGELPRYSGTANAFSTIARREGFRKGLYRGTSATIARAVCLSGAQLGTYDQFKVWLRDREVMEEGVALHTVAAMTSAVVAQTVAMPADTLKTRVLNSQRADATLRHVTMQTLKVEGFRALFRGYVPAITRQAPVIVVQMPIVEQIRLALGVGYL